MPQHVLVVGISDHILQSVGVPKFLTLVLVLPEIVGCGASDGGVPEYGEGLEVGRVPEYGECLGVMDRTEVRGRPVGGAEVVGGLNHLSQVVVGCVRQKEYGERKN